MTFLLVLALAAALYWVVQRSTFAPFPHAADDFVGGLAIGLVIAGGIGWLGARR